VSTIIVAGTVRVPPENLTCFRPEMEAMLSATRAEDGCIDYAYAADLMDLGLIRVFEVWRDQLALDAHFKSAHMAEWRARWPEFGVSQRKLIAYEVASEYPL